jgi:hypothetical protein
MACGKLSNDLYGNDPVDRGWDDSCVLNAVVVKPEELVEPYRSKAEQAISARQAAKGGADA